jgi:hypothetical protein
VAESGGYPKVPSKAWRELRSRARSAPSVKFTPDMVAALLGFGSPQSASTNVVAPMRRIGLFDDNGGLTPLGNKWRVDASYGDACQEILDNAYPSDLAALTDGSGSPDINRVRTWFGHQGFGDSNARQMAATYVMIASKKLPESGAPPEPAKGGTPGGEGRAAKKAAAARKAAGPRTRTRASVPVASGPPASDDQPTGSPAYGTHSGLNVHLDIQIHIPAEATAQQIDQIFESMARHLYKQ